MKVLWIFNHPAPYKIALFNELGKTVDLTVIFERDGEGDRIKDFYYGKAVNFKMILLHALKLGLYNNWSSKLVKHLKKNQYDLIVMNGWSSLTEMAGIRYLKRHKIPYIFSINGGIAKEKEVFWKRNLKRKYIPGASMYLAPDPNSAEYLIHYGAPKEKISLYPYSTIHESEIVERPLTAKERAEARKAKGLSEKPLYLTLGQFAERKNNMALLEAWKEAKLDAELLLIGNGPLKEKYLEYIQANDLQNVTVKDYVKHDEAMEYLRIADASVFLTKEDIYGHVVNESLSQGTPIFASEHANAARNLIQDGKNGHLIDISDPKKIIEGLKKPISEEMGVKARETALRNTIEIMSDTHIKLFEEFLRG